MSELSGVEKTLNERGQRYGDFEEFANTCSAFKKLAGSRMSPHIDDFKSYHIEALDMIFHKIARVINGDPDYADSWHDIAGYATLVEQIINRRKNE